jgi:hypothetical protein
MTAAIDGDAQVLVLPNVASREANAQCPQGPAPARAREDAPKDPGGWVRQARRPVPKPAPEVAGDKPSRVPPARLVTGVLSGASLVHAPPPALMTVWAGHVAAAKYYRSPAARWARFVYGGWHCWVLAPPAYFVVWALDSPPKGFAVVCVLVALLWLLHVPPF